MKSHRYKTMFETGVFLFDKQILCTLQKDKAVLFAGEKWCEDNEGMFVVNIEGKQGKKPFYLQVRVSRLLPSLRKSLKSRNAHIAACQAKQK